MLRLYGKALHRVDAGWLNAFGWSNIGIGRYFDEYFARTARLNRIVSVGGFSADEIEQLFETVNERAKPGEIAAIELNARCHNVNFPFETILEESLRRAVPKSRHPVILKVSPDEDYRWQARLAEEHGCAAITAINTVKGLRLDPETGEPYLQEPLRRRLGAGDQADRPAGRRRSCARPGIRLPIIANGGIRDFDDCREYVWAGADAVSLGSAVWLQPMPLYALGPLEGLRIRRLISRMERYVPPATAPHWRPAPAAARRCSALAADRGGRRPSRARRVSLPASPSSRRAARSTPSASTASTSRPTSRPASASRPASSSRGSRRSWRRSPRATEVPFRRLRAHALTDGDLADLVDLVRGLLDRDEADGVVVTHGTNTLEETAWLLHLVIGDERPVVVTGAMRPASALSGDGPLNVVNAVRAGGVAGCARSRHARPARRHDPRRARRDEVRHDAGLGVPRRRRRPARLGRRRRPGRAQPPARARRPRSAAGSPRPTSATSRASTSSSPTSARTARSSMRRLPWGRAGS